MLQNPGSCYGTDQKRDEDFGKYINSMKKKTKKMNEGWSDKYKKSIDCDNPKGFSQVK